MPKSGSGRVLSFTNAATTVVGTVASCHPLATNCGVEMTSPLASTLAEVCRDQPSRSGSLASGSGFAVDVSWPRREEASTDANTKRERASRMREFMVLLINVLLVICRSLRWRRDERLLAGNLSAEWISLLLIRFNRAMLQQSGLLPNGLAQAHSNAGSLLLQHPVRIIRL